MEGITKRKRERERDLRKEGQISRRKNSKTSKNRNVGNLIRQK